MASADPQYDPHAAFYAYAPGVMLTDTMDAALALQYQANGYTPLTQAQVLAIAGALPAYPAGMKRFEDSNPTSFDDWAIDAPDRAMFAG